MQLFSNLISLIIEKSINFPGDYSKYSTSINKSVYSNGVNITLSEILCDGEAIYTTYRIEGDEPLPYSLVDNEALDPTNDLILAEEYIDLGFANEDDLILYNLEGKFIDDKTFIGVQKYSLSNINTKIPDEFNFKIKISDIVSFHEENIMTIDGSWAFDIPVKVNKYLNTKITLDYIVDDYSIKSLTITPFDIILKGSLPISGEVIDYDNKSIDYEVYLYDDDNVEILNSNGHRSLDNDSIFTYHKPVNDTKSINLIIKKRTLQKINYSTSSWTYDLIDEEIILDETIQFPS